MFKYSKLNTFNGKRWIFCKKQCFPYHSCESQPMMAGPRAVGFE